MLFRYVPSTDGSLDVTSVALRVLCSLCECDAGARRRAVNLRQWFKQWKPCVAHILRDQADLAAWLARFG